MNKKYIIQSILLGIPLFILYSVILIYLYHLVFDVSSAMTGIQTLIGGISALLANYTNTKMYEGIKKVKGDDL